MAVVVGVLALQGAFKEHVDALNSLNKDGMHVDAMMVRSTDDMIDIDGLIIPGGESTVMHRLMHTSGLHSCIKDWISCDRPTFGTCAGLILMADRIEGKDGPLVGGLGVTVKRNAYGRQQESFTTHDVQLESGSKCTGVFIRAPAITSAGKTDPVANFNSSIVGVQQGNLLGLAFHPELTEDLHWHKLFIKMVSEFKKQ